MAANYVLLERIELNASAASVTFSNIPQSGYTDLKFVMSARQSTAAVAADVLVEFNGNAANNSNKYLIGDSASASSGSNGYTPSSNYISIGVGNNATANTFSSVEMYIPNYLSSNSKSFTVDSVSESNGTTSVFQLMLAGLWASSSAINQIKVTPASSQSFRQYSTFSLYGLAAIGTTPAIAPKATGGNNVTTDSTYWYHAFTSSGTFTPLAGITADVLTIAGGGGGTTYDGTATTNGTNSSITGGSLSLTAAVGGGAGGYQYNGGNGGSGGGGASQGNIYSGGTGTTGQGNRGGDSWNQVGGGGGGAGAAGVTASSGVRPDGGAGVNTYSSWATATLTGVSGYYAGGGGGGITGGTAGNGGAGGGGAGGTSGSSGTAGTINTGGGAGGGSNGGNQYGGGGGGAGGLVYTASQSLTATGYTVTVGAGGNGNSKGGSGIVIVRYAV